MSVNRFTLGVTASLVWICIMAGVAIVDLDAAYAMGPNEWGDFFAGFFAPIAFLWLVLGYLQQGDELRLSTEALHLQAEELRHSVEQQRELVEVTRQQLESEREAFRLERVARLEAAKPLFVVRNDGLSFSATDCIYSMIIANAGNTATHVTGVLEGDEISSVKLIDVAMFTRASEGRATMTLPARFPDIAASLTIDYLDAYGLPGRCKYGVRKQDATPDSMLAFSLIEG